MRNWRPAARLAGPLAVAVLVTIATSCGGGGGGDGPTPPPTVNNTPATITLSPSAPVSVASGTTTTITATVLNSAGNVVSATVSWNTSDATVAQVSGGVVTGVRVGTATITAAVGAVTSSGLAVAVTPGAAAALSIRTQPGGAVVSVPLPTQPVIEVRDAAGNLATSSIASVTAAFASGGGTISSATASAVAGVATFTGVTLVGLAGARTLSFSATGLSSVTSASFTLGVGAPVALGIRTEPSGAAVAAPFSNQPLIEVRDAGANVVQTATDAIVATLASGGGTLSGTTTSTAVTGVATFSNLTLTGIVGARTISFSAPGRSPVTSASFALAPGAPSQLLVATQPVGGAVGAPLLTQPVVELRDVAGNVATTTVTSVTATVSFGAGAVLGTVTVASANGLATFSNLAVSGTPGERELTFSANGMPAVVSARFSLASIVYGVAGQKFPIVDVGGAVTPTSSAATPPAYVSRAPSRATVDNTGRITARAEGQSWVVSTITGGSDSVLAIVTRSAGGPILRTNLAVSAVASGTAMTVDLVLDPRSTPVGATSLYVSPVLETGPLTATPFVVQPPGAQVAASITSPGVYRYVIASAAGISTPVTFGRLQFTAGPPGSVLTINVTAIDAFAPDGSDVLPRMTSTFYMVIFK